ncbi:MAG: type IV secretory system conjugative DNA transfer family protein [Candidatus Methanomethylicaceae archaeon]
MVVSIPSSLISTIQAAARDWAYTQGLYFARLDPHPYLFSTRVGVEFVPPFNPPSDPHELSSVPDSCWAVGVGYITSTIVSHTFLTGQTGSGKTSAMRALIRSVRDHADHVAIIDPKGFDFRGFEVGSLGGGSNYAFSDSDILDLLRRVYADVTSFYSALSAASLSQGRHLVVPSSPSKYLFVDELGMLSKEAVSLLDQIMRFCRAAGWVVVVATQHAQKDKSPIREHCAVVFAFTRLDVSAAASALGLLSDQDALNKIPSGLRRPGVAFVRPASLVGAYPFDVDRDIGLVYFVDRDSHDQRAYAYIASPPRSPVLPSSPNP